MIYKINYNSDAEWVALRAEEERPMAESVGKECTSHKCESPKVFLLHPQQFFPCTLLFLKKNYFTLFKNDLQIIFSGMFLKHTFQDTFYEFRIFHFGSQKNMFRKIYFGMVVFPLDFLFLKQFCLQKIPISAWSKTVKDNLGI